jgi:hypothetical protein
MRTVPAAALTRRPSQEALLIADFTRNFFRDSIEMQDTKPSKMPTETRADVVPSSSMSNDHSSGLGITLQDTNEEGLRSHEPLRLYKRRFFGLFQLVLLNIIVSWDVSQSRILNFVSRPLC